MNVTRAFWSGPVDPDGLPEGATLTRRFGVAQKDKIRPIDDYRASMVNSSVTQAEAVSIPRGGPHCSHVRRVPEVLISPDITSGAGGEVLDLASAYKQVPLSDSHISIFPAAWLEGCRKTSWCRTKPAARFWESSLNLLKTPEGVIALANTASRRAELMEFIDHIQATKKLSRSDAERFRAVCNSPRITCLAEDFATA